jgi:hypothetical protein
MFYYFKYYQIQHYFDFQSVEPFILLILKLLAKKKLFNSVIGP